MDGNCTRRDFLKLAAVTTAYSLSGGGMIAHARLEKNNVADRVITNARVATMDPRNPSASAIAIKDGLFLAVGSDDEAMAHRGIGTEVIDAGRGTVIPGLNDSHTHVIRGGLNYNLELRWDGVPSLADALRMLREQAKRTPPPQWVRVIGGWSEFQFAEQRMPTLQEINTAAPDTPVFVLLLYARALLNQAALRALGFTKDTPNPPGGLIERDGKGIPTGMLIAEPNAFILYSTIAKAPRLSYEDQLNSSRQFMRELNRLGVTSVIDAGGGGQNYPEDYRVIEDLAKSGHLTLRFAYNLFAQKPSNELQDFARWIKMTGPGRGNDFLRMNGGGENLVWSAADFENFLEPRPDLSPVMENELKAVVGLLAENRWPFRIHATYNESISRFLRIFEEVNKEVPFNGMRWFIDHAETITSQNIERVRALGGGIAIQHRMAFQGEYFIGRYGAQAAEHTPPVKRMLEMGVPVGGGTDATRVASYNPWVSLYWLVAGRTVGGTPLYPELNRLSRTEALRLWTAGSSWFSGEEGKKGMIAPGKFADLAILSDDYFSVEEERIKRIESVLTIVDGKIVYATGDFGRLAPPLLSVSPDWSPVNEYGGYHRSAAPLSSSVSSCSCAHPHEGHGYPLVLGSSGELWRMGCDCFVL
ncbi:MAG: amidohydrolase [Deltaproteobacteria bacterium]|nr:amidohydrolase [Deltaproteobacteria bacterium]